MSPNTFDCIVVGSGHAASSAALSAIEAGSRRVLVVEKGPAEWVGGNGYFTAGAHRTVHGGLQDLLPIVTNVAPETAATIDMDPYTPQQFTDDLMRLSDGRSDPAMVKAVVDGSRDAVGWLAEKAYLVNGRQKFWGGKGLIAAHRRALEEAGVETWFDTPAVELVTDEGIIAGLVVERGGQRAILNSPSVVLACGGPRNALQHRRRLHSTRPLNASLIGDFSATGCHSTCWDANAPSDCGDRVLSNQFTKSGYPLGIMVNARGQRFVDEGEDFRNYTYAKFGRAILHQPGGCAFQVWDSEVVEWLRKEEYDDGVVEKVWAQSVEELADALSQKGLEDKAAFVHTIEAYNAAVRASKTENPSRTWDPAVKDGLSTVSSQPQLSVDPPKSNWALPLEKPPFLAVKVACGITFTFGGLAINPNTANVLNEKGENIRGLFATGEVVGGLFYGNYPGGSGLTAGAVFGRKAGAEAAKLAAQAA
ncbi:uncharacterized protein B0H18DRAFT_1086395 [Fomitopsis serialis]|uniref:uncharacterized protein n=1 Tax=Fomitopsis serialis TaxID=139415 RepID=UPI00200859DF|nr:uncharacterized protein B0H18DRAFT_1086395 [Neoantrodia serialis]KAH9920490.1 hypothetical protein B0H18DRAFT_1086395 [Neoantrodia serialis]